MLLAKVIGKVVATRKEESLVSYRFLVVEEMDPKDESLNGRTLVAVDTLGAGVNDVVLVARGGAARMISNTTRDMPLDATIVGIVDTVDVYV
jgi:ethanolamine utilization protein EutN